MSRRMRLLVSLVLAASAVVVCLWYAGRVQAEAQRVRREAVERYGGEVVSLVVAARTIEAGETVASADVEVREWLSSLAPLGAKTGLGDVVGREVTVPVSLGVPLTDLNFRDVAEYAEVPAGHVAVSVPVSDKLGVGPGIATGTHLVAYRVKEDAAEVACADATVLVAPSAAALSGRGTLVLAVGASDVAEVLSASTDGDLRLVVPADDVRMPAEGETDHASEPSAPASVAPSDLSTSRGAESGASGHMDVQSSESVGGDDQDV